MLQAQERRLRLIVPQPRQWSFVKDRFGASTSIAKSLTRKWKDHQE